MPSSDPQITEPGLTAHFGRWIGTHFRGVKGVDRILRILHDPDQRQDTFFRTIATAYPEGPQYHLESRWFNEWITWFYGSQDRRIHRWIVQHAHPDWVTFDVGMNFGYFTCLLALRCKEVHGFEPVGWLAGRARANVALNGFENVTINEVALSDHTGTAQLNLPAEDDCNWGTSSLVHQSSSMATIEVALDTLESYCTEHEIKRLDFIKVDVEGAEHLVLQGGGAILERFRPTVIFEHNEESAPAIYGLLERIGYRLTDIEGQPLALQEAPLHDVLAIYGSRS